MRALLPSLDLLDLLFAKGAYLARDGDTARTDGIEIEEREIVIL